jgi:hypothetical protein
MKLKKIAAAATIAAAALTGTVAATGEASAKVSSGCYTFHQNMWGINSAMKATVRGGTFRAGNTRARIVSTRAGGHFDLGPNRYGLVKSGPRYVGTIYWLGIPSGSTKLVPRRC